MSNFSGTLYSPYARHVNIADSAYRHAASQWLTPMSAQKFNDLSLNGETPVVLTSNGTNQTTKVGALAWLYAHLPIRFQ